MKQPSMVIKGFWNSDDYTDTFPLMKDVVAKFDAGGYGPPVKGECGYNIIPDEHIRDFYTAEVNERKMKEAKNEKTN